jgi:DNA-binding response OmpR family regulator
MKILIVEDEPDLLKSIKTYLSQNNFLCDVADNIREAREHILDSEYNCVILDITFPVGSGFEILRKIKEIKKNCGVLIISAKDSLDDKLLGLELGADDYMTKPFHLPELAARLHAINRRRNFDGNDLLIVDKLIVNVQDKYVKTDSGTIELTRKEFDLLLYFISNKNKVVTKQSIIDYLWGDQADMTDNYDLIYVHIKNLRKKLVDKGCPDYISAVYGMGYRFSVKTQLLGI